MSSSGKLLSTAIILMSTALASGCSKDSPAPGAAGSAAPAGDKPAAAVKATGKLTAAECQKLYQHVMDVGLNEALKDSTNGMSEAEKKVAVEAARKEMKDDPEAKKLAAGCENEITRDEYDCMMKATTEKALDACDKQ